MVKPVPPKSDRLKTHAEIASYLEGSRCICGDAKNGERPCCFACFSNLSPQLQWDLFELSNMLDYREAITNLETEIRAKIRKREPHREESEIA